MSDATPMTKAQLQHRREQGRKLHQEATSGDGDLRFWPEDVLRVWDSASARVRAWHEDFLRRRQAS